MIGRLAGILAVCLLAAACGTPGGLQHTDIPPLAGHRAVFDQALVDQASHRLYLADGGLQSVDVFDVSQASPRYLASVKLGHVPHGLAVAADLRKVFVGMDGGGIAVIEADPGAKGVNRVLTVIQTSAPKNIDLVDYDPGGHLLWAAGSDDGILFKVDAIRNLVLGALPLLAGLEQPRYDPGQQALYLPDQTKNLLYKIDPGTLQVIQQWDLGTPCSPAGLGIDSRRQLALIGCLDPSLSYTLVWDLKAGSPVRTLSDIGDADQVVYEPAAEVFMVAGSANGTTAIGFFGGSPIAFQSLKYTHADTRAVAFDESTRTVYVPDAKAGSEGLESFALPAPQAAPPPFLAPILYLLPLVVVGAVVWYYGRRRARERRLAGRPMYS
jgi:hypothetical protein